MMVLDGSAVFAVLLDEQEARECVAAIEGADPLLMSAGSLTEMLIVAAGKGVLPQTRNFVSALKPTVVPVTEQRALDAAEAFVRWGRGFHKARLNFGDCFAYALAKELACPLLYVGNDFAHTDVISALA
jgi:ribonuclease VapC